MHWTQKGARRYLYRTYRNAEGKVCREFLGTGHKAKMIFIENQLRRAEEASRQKYCQERLERIANVEQECGPFTRWADLLVRAALSLRRLHRSYFSVTEGSTEV